MMTRSLGLLRGVERRFFVHGFRREGSLCKDASRPTVIHAAKKTAAIAFVANSGANRIDANEKSVCVAVNTNVSNFEDMAAGLACFPELVARAGKKYDFAGALRDLKRLAIHEAEHQH